MRNVVDRLQTRERGQVIVLFAFAIVALVAFAGIALEGGMMYVQRRTAQSAADAGALAGTRALRNATLASQVGDVSAAVTTYAQANTFGVTPTVTCAYFVGTSGQPIATLVNNAATCSGTPVAQIPSAASGVQVMVEIPFQAHLVTILGFSTLRVDAQATGQVGTLTAFDARQSPLIACGGGAGGALWIPTIAPAVVTTTPGILAATPAHLPSFNPDDDDLTSDVLLVTPGPGVPNPPQYALDASKDGRTYYLKGQHLNSESPSGDCGASGFKGAAATIQPTPYVKNTADGTDDIMWGDTGNSVPQISQRVASSGSCAAGTSIDNFTGGSPGCVMVLPVAYDDAAGGMSGTRPLKVGGWGAFYVWCLRSTGAGCQVIAGQYLANWPIASGTSVNTWTFGQRGSLTTIRLTG